MSTLLTPTHHLLNSLLTSSESKNLQHPKSDAKDLPEAAMVGLRGSGVWGPKLELVELGHQPRVNRSALSRATLRGFESMAEVSEP